MRPTVEKKRFYLVLICSVDSEKVTDQALIRINALSDGKIDFTARYSNDAVPRRTKTDFGYKGRLSENDRHAWEQVIQGICQIF